MIKRVCMIAGAIGFVGMVMMSNAWYVEDGVLSKLKAEHPKVKRMRVIRSERNIFDYSVIFVDEDGQRKSYLIDTNALSRYHLYPASDGN